MSKKIKMPINANELVKLADQIGLDHRKGNGKVVVHADDNRAFVVSDHPREFDTQTKNRLKKWLLTAGILVGILLFVIIRSWFGLQA